MNGTSKLTTQKSKLAEGDSEAPCGWPRNELLKDVVLLLACGTLPPYDQYTSATSGQGKASRSTTSYGAHAQLLGNYGRPVRGARCQGFHKGFHLSDGVLEMVLHSNKRFESLLVLAVTRYEDVRTEHEH